MATGTLKMWKAERGFGFILNDAGGLAQHLVANFVSIGVVYQFEVIEVEHHNLERPTRAACP